MIFVIILLAAILIGGIYAWLTIRSKIRDVSRIAFGTDDIVEGFANQEYLDEITPKSVAGITSLMIPQIEKDFPEFHWPEWKQRCEIALQEYLESLEQGHLCHLDDCSESLRESVRQKITDNSQQNLTVKYDGIKIHQTEINDYRKNAGICCIRMQTSLEYLYSCSGESPVEAKREQHRYNMELFYVQDTDKVDPGETVVNVVCSQCGAPIKNLGTKLCEYCGSAVVPINIRAWQLSKIEQKD